MREVVLGTRDSSLALWQTKWVAERLQDYHPGLKIKVVAVKTKGDKITDVALSKIGDKGLFTKELEISLVDGEIDAAVHSVKDLPTELPVGLELGVICEREEPADVLLASPGGKMENIPAGARLGTSSLRRRAQLLHHRPDLRIEDIRGNLNTRLAKMETMGLDAIVLAAAGVKRLGWDDRIAQVLSYDICLPAVGQGSIGLEVRQGDQVMAEILSVLNHRPSELAIRAERSFMRVLQGGCQIPVGALASLQGQQLTLQGVVATVDGTGLVRGSITGLAGTAEELGEKLAQELLSGGAKAILTELRNSF